MARAVSPQVLTEWQRVFDCWNRGDFDEMLAAYARDGSFDVSAVFPDIAPAHGHSEILGAWAALTENLDGLRLDPVDVLALGSGRYVVDMRLWGEGRRSGAAVDRRYGYICTFHERDGKCIRAELLPDVDAALTRGTTDRRES
jgi:ketosteroid isomerase-like protein